jgi:L-ascorbate metabolism protein UlaG (beta-lactamase superfamily)
MADSDENNPEAASEDSNSSRLKKALWIGPLILLVILTAIISSGSFYLRHSSYAIPDNAKAPASTKNPNSALVIRYLGVTGYEISDGKTTIITDPCINRPTALELIYGRLKPDANLSKKWVPRADYILVNHAHYDHSIDAPEIALRTGATVIGSQSVINLVLSRGVKKEQTIVAKDGEKLQCGTFTVNIARATHSRVLGQQKPMSGTISKDAKELWFFQYTMDGSFSYRMEANGSSVWFHPSTVYKKGELKNLNADTLIMGVNGQPLTEQVARDVMAEVGARRVIPTHFDNFFQPLSKGLSLMPDLDLDRAKQLLLLDRADIAWYVLDYDQKLYLPTDINKSQR